MTGTSTEQMRALADETLRLGIWHRQTTAALRAAADQLDAVQAVADYLRDERWDDPTFDPELRLRAILTADTARQEDR